MNGLKNILQDIAYLIAVFLILTWTGVRFEWYQWLIIVLGHVVYGAIQYNRGMNFAVKVIMDRMEPCDDPNCEACTERKAKA